MSRVRRVFHPGPGLAEGATIVLDPEESRHVGQVLRLRSGDEVSVFDGVGGEYAGVLVGERRDAVTVCLGRPLEGEVDPPLRLVLHPALCRHDRMEWVVQKGTELGVAAFRPLLSARVESRPPTAARLGRWRRIAREACKQCGRRVVPAVDEPLAVAPVPAAGVPALALDAGPRSSTLDGVLGRLSSRRAARAELWLAVGPEGGFTREEVAAMRRDGWQPVSLGPRTLRAETAALCGAAIVLHRLADLGRAGDGVG